MFYVYAITSDLSQRIYIGFTSDIDKRLRYHNSGYVKSTAKDRPWKLSAFEELETKSQATWLERSLKRSRGKRLKWLAKNRING